VSATNHQRATPSFRSVDTLLSHLTVAEFGHEVGVRYCGHLFAAMGARVVRFGKREDAKIGFGGSEGEAYGRWLDGGKLERATTAFDPAFDVVIAGQTDKDLAAAADFAQSLRRTPLLVGITWFANRGPYAGWIGSDEIIGALNGVAYPFGEPEGPPMLSQGHAYQVTAGLVAFNACLAALVSPPSLRPRRVDTNVFEASLCFAETGALTGRFPEGRVVRLGINKFVPTYPAGPYRTSDGWVGVTCLTPAQWSALSRLIGREELAADPRFATAYQRLMLSADVDAALTPSFLLRPAAEWVALGMRHRIPIAPMERPGDLPKVDHWRARGAFREFDGGAVAGPTLPYLMRFDGVAAAGKPASGPVLLPLSHVRVIDFSMGWAGPLCARTLADLGADVIKVESESHPDWWRGWEAGAVDAEARETKHNFIDMNRNKRGVDIDLTTMTGAEQAKALIRTADVVVENYAAGVLAKLGLGQSVQRELNPGIISLSMPAFGNGGPLSNIRAYGSTVEQASGLPFVNGEADWAPAQQHVAFGDPIAGLYGASAVLAALLARDKAGGADIDLAQVACLFQLGADAIIAEQVRDRPLARTGHARPRQRFCAAVPTRDDDRWLVVAAQDEDAVDRLAKFVGGPDEQALRRWAARHTAEDAAMTLQLSGVCAAPIYPSDVLSTNAQLVASGFWVEMERSHVGRHLVAAAPFAFDGERPPLRLPAPLLGEHSSELLSP
jgi:crotonobetainyl-CoA:carnitine CoA-transferase CaiB-like acyl-CoA transferase